MTFAMLCFFLYGCSSRFIRFWYGVLTHHCHQVKTAYGVSHGSYSYEEASPIHGPGKDPQAAPVPVSSLRPSSSKHKIGYPAALHSVTPSNPACTPTKLRCTSMTIPAPPTALCHGSKPTRRRPPLLTTYRKMLKFGSVYYLHQEGYSNCANASTTLWPGNLMMKDVHPSAPRPTLPRSNSLTGTIKTQKPSINTIVNAVHRYLGLWNSPALSMKAHLQALSSKARTYSQRLYKSGLDKSDVWLAYFACFLPAMTFTLTVTSFTFTQLRTLHKITIRVTLAKLGFNSNISRNHLREPSFRWSWPFKLHTASAPHSTPAGRQSGYPVGTLLPASRRHCGKIRRLIFRASSGPGTLA
jgi:hypothetical protein